MIYYVCSWGGCGSKMLCRYLDNFGKTYHVHSPEPPKKLTKVGVDTYAEWFSSHELQDVSNTTVIFLYRDPVRSILSRFRNPNHLKHIQSPIVSLDAVIKDGVDYYGLNKFFDNYTKPNGRNYSIYAIKYELLFDQKNEFNKYFNLSGAEFPKKKETSQLETNHSLELLYSQLRDKIKQMPFIKKIHD